MNHVIASSTPPHVPQRPRTVLDYALSYAGKGLLVFPCWGVTQEGACRCGEEARCARPGKHPIGRLVPSGLLDATSDEGVIRNWFGKYPEANIAIRTGFGRVVIDIDAYKGGGISFELLLERFGPLPATLTVKTGSGNGSRHLYFSYSEGLAVKSHSLVVPGLAIPGIDVKADGGYVIAPPSRHASGGFYTFDDEDDSILAPAPAWLLALIASPPTKEPSAPLPTGFDLDEETAIPITDRLFATAARKVEAGGARHDAIVWFYVQCKDNAVPRDIAEMWIDQWLDLARESGASRSIRTEEITRVITWAYSKDRRDPLPDVARLLASANATPPTPIEAAPATDPPSQAQTAPQPAPTKPTSPRLASPSTMLEELLAKEITLVSTPIPALDRVLGGGFETGTNVVIATQAGGGKTAFLVQSAAAAVKSGDFHAVLALRDGNQWRDTARLAQMAGIDRFKLRDKDPATVAAAREAIQRYDERIRIYDTLAAGACVNDMIDKALAWTSGTHTNLIIGIDSIHVFPVKDRADEESKQLYDKIGYRLQAVHDIVIEIDALGVTIGQSGRSTYGKRKEEDNADLLTAVAGGHVAENSIDILAVITKPRSADKVCYLVLPKSRLGGQGEKVPIRYDADRSMWFPVEFEDQPQEEATGTQKISIRESAKAERKLRIESDVEHALKSFPEGASVLALSNLTGRRRDDISEAIGALHARGWVQPCHTEKTDKNLRKQRVSSWKWTR